MKKKLEPQVQISQLMIYGCFKILQVLLSIRWNLYLLETIKQAIKTN